MDAAKLRIAHFITSMDARMGGVAAVIAGLAPAQARAGLDVTVVSAWAEGEATDANELTTAGVKVQLIGPVRRRLGGHPQMQAQVQAAVFNSDVVHIHALWEHLQHYAARAAQRAGKPYVFSPHGMLDPWSLKQSALVKRIYMALRLRRNLNRATLLHYTAELEKQLVQPLGLTPGGVVIPNGLRLDEFEQLPERGTFRRKFPQLGQRPIVLFLSRVHYKKGLDLLVPAFAQAKLQPDAMLVIAGPPAKGYLTEVQAMVRQHGLEDRTIFTGMLRGLARIEAMVDADLFVLPSRQENFGIVIIEALAAKCPVVISDQVNIHREITAAGVGGVVPLDITKLAAEINRWMTEHALRDPAIAKARDFVWRNYDWNTIVRQWVAVYSELACPGTRPFSAALVPTGERP
jgi:glycosyltransferase involved in cell wall biosynthesis